jgi:hypothetical protein
MNKGYEYLVIAFLFFIIGMALVINYLSLVNTEDELKECQELLIKESDE